MIMVSGELVCPLRDKAIPETIPHAARSYLRSGEPSLATWVKCLTFCLPDHAYR